MRKDTDLELELHAYVDGDLDEESMARVEAYLRSNPDAAAKIHDYLRQKDDLKRAASQRTPLDESPALAELGRHLAKRLQRGSRAAWRRPVAVAVLFIFGWLSHTFYAPLAQVPAFANEVVQAHLLTSTDISEIPPISPERISKLFSRIGEIERLPDLRAFGFEPVGAQLLPSDEGAVLHVPYRDEKGVLVSYFLLHDEDDDELPRHILHKNGITMVYWQHHHSRYALAAPLADEHISRIATFLDSPQGALEEHFDRNILQ
jgi:anti-sigma factor RsiW